MSKQNETPCSEDQMLLTELERRYRPAELTPREAHMFDDEVFARLEGPGLGRVWTLSLAGVAAAVVICLGLFFQPGAQTPSATETPVLASAEVDWLTPLAGAESESDETVLNELPDEYGAIALLMGDDLEDWTDY